MRFTVLGSVEHTQVLAGYGTDNAQINGGAQIGPVKIGGDWSQSSISAGFNPGGDGVFGTSDDTRIGSGPANIIGSIASIQIKGGIVGTGSGGDHYGFVAGQIGKFTTGRFKAPLTGSATPDVTEVGGFTGDVTVREIV